MCGCNCDVICIHHYRSCHRRYSATTLLICHSQRPQSSRVCYAVDIIIWASGVKILELARKINDYLKEMSLFLRANSLLISAPKSSVTLFTPDPTQAHCHPAIRIEGTRLPLESSPKLLGVYLDTFFSFNYHCGQVTTRVKKRNNVLKALAGTSWGQQKETLQMTYKALGRSIANYAAPVWSTNASTSSIGSLQKAQNEALRIITGAHKMSSIDHLHCETEMLRVEEHLNLLSAQYLIQCLEPDSAYKKNFSRIMDGHPSQDEEADTVHQAPSNHTAAAVRHQTAITPGSLHGIRPELTKPSGSQQSSRL